MAGSPKRLFIITGDHSGDIHAGKAVLALKRLQPDLEIAAVGGEQLRAIGVNLVSDQAGLGKMGAGSVLSAPYHFLLGKRVMAFLKSFRPDAVLLIDYGMFNLWMAKQLKPLGIPVYYFIPPQVWASRRGRIQQIRKYVDHVFCIFPFEETLYRRENIPVTYVGHPLVGELPTAANRAEFCQQYGLDPARPIVGIFPGSRTSEIAALLPQIIPALSLIQQDRPAHTPPIQFVLAKAGSLPGPFFQERLADAWKKACVFIKKAGIEPANIVSASQLRVIENDNHALMGIADALIAKSGTTTLEAALYRTPMILIYKIHPLVYPIALKIAYLPCLGLPNILTSMEDPPVPELWQDAVNPREMSRALLPLLDRSSAEYQKQQAAFDTIQTLLNVGATPENLARELFNRLN